MKTRFLLLLAAGLFGNNISNAQTNTFPQSGSVGIGTITPASQLQVLGATRLGSTTDFVQVDADGSLSLTGAARYMVAGNRYVFQYDASPNYGLFFNSTKMHFEFRDAFARPMFSVNANTGDGFFKSGVTIGSSALTTPGNLRWTGTDFEGYSATGWKSLTGKNSWSLTGNAGTNPNDNFIGTTDAAPLMFKVNNNKAGSINSSNENASYGYQSLLNDQGSFNSAFGTGALKDNTSTGNTAIGSGALTANTGGYQNTATGANALFKNKNGNYNTANGLFALFSNTSGSDNTAVGRQALGSNTFQSGNTAIGTRSLYKNVEGSINTAVGYMALEENTSGRYNTASGGLALNMNTTGFNNTADGVEALRYNTTGFRNTAVGHQASYDNTSGTYNVSFGNGAGNGNTKGSYNTHIGVNTRTFDTSLTNTTALGYQAVTTAKNQVRIGNQSVTSIGGYANWSNLSDGRFKKNIKENVPGLDFIKALKPITYTVDVRKISNYLLTESRDGQNENSSTRTKDADEERDMATKEQEIQTGFIAQDVEKVAKKLGYQFSGVDAPKNGKDFYGLRYAEFVVPLVKAVQELSTTNEELTTETKELQTKIRALENEMAEIRALITGKKDGAATVDESAVISKHVILTSSTLEQNFPNPFTKATTIKYALIKESSSAKIVITDKAGKIIKQVNLSPKGNGAIQLDTSGLSSGTYTYTLYADNKLVDTKQMVLVQ